MDKQRLPPWVRSTLPPASALAKITRRTYCQGLATVCREARCPNRGECFSKGTAAFLILGDVCTRDCRFCAVKHGIPQPPEPSEPVKVAESVAVMGLTHAVVTSVTRDDLEDGGAWQFVATIRAIREMCPGVGIEVLIPDFRGSADALRQVVEAGPDVINHNPETVPRLYPLLRHAAIYERSLELLARVRQYDPQIYTKSGIMVGVGETLDEVRALIRDLVGVGCAALTIGQYLRPTKDHYPVKRIVPPEEFEQLEDIAMAEGIPCVAAGPLVRSSYAAGQMLRKLKGLPADETDPGESVDPCIRNPCKINS